QSINLFITKDFKNYQQASTINPEKNYNWLTTELVTWKMTDGRLSQGILYKPENFDSSKKYPLIIDIYEKRSDELNTFLRPAPAGGRINISTYASNGYLVFVPDIHYRPLYNGESITNSVVSAVQFLSRFSWVDSTKVG